MRILFGTGRPAFAAVNWQWVEENCSDERVCRLKSMDPQRIPVSDLLEGATEIRFFDVLENGICHDRVAPKSTSTSFPMTSAVKISNAILPD